MKSNQQTNPPLLEYAAPAAGRARTTRPVRVTATATAIFFGLGMPGLFFLESRHTFGGIVDYFMSLMASLAGAAVCLLVALGVFDGGGDQSKGTG